MRRDDEHDRALALRARAGDDGAFAELVARHRDALVRAVSCRSGRPELAEDAVQEGLLAALRALRSGTGAPSDVRAWLHTIAWRRTIDLVRRERPLLSLDAETELGAAPSTEQQVLQAAELDRVVAAWGALADRQRDALAMSVLEGRSLEEIAAALDVNVSGAKSLVARGRRTLLERMTTGDLPCTDVRLEVLAAAERGVRLSGDVTRHVRGCRACSRLHRAARLRRRARAAVYAPVGVLVALDQRLGAARDRVRDALFTTAGQEPSISIATKLCVGACVTALSGSTAAPLATSLPERGLAAATAAVAAQHAGADHDPPPRARPQRTEPPALAQTTTTAGTPPPAASPPAATAPAAARKPGPAARERPRTRHPDPRSVAPTLRIARAAPSVPIRTDAAGRQTMTFTRNGKTTTREVVVTDDPTVASPAPEPATTAPSPEPSPATPAPSEGVSAAAP